MHRYDPKLLRKLAATYRARAMTEPDRAAFFLEVAKDMELHAGQMEAGAKDAARPKEKAASALGSR